MHYRPLSFLSDASLDLLLSRALVIAGRAFRGLYGRQWLRIVWDSQMTLGCEMVVARLIWEYAERHKRPKVKRKKL